MKRYIRVKHGVIFDLSKYEIEYDNLDNLCISSKDDYYDNYRISQSDIIAESDNILDLIQVGDLIEDDTFASLQFVTSLLTDIIKDRVENYNVKTPEELSIYKIYTKQNDNYVLVWNKERGVI